MKLFIGVRFSRNVSDKIAARQAAVRQAALGGSFPPPENFHMTMAFLGECERSQVRDVRQAMREATIDRHSFPALIRENGAFLRPDGRIMYLQVHGGGHLTELHEALCESLEARGFELPDDEKRRNYRPHITIGREVDLSKDAMASLPETDIPFCVDHLTLMLSARVHGLIRYSELETVRLAGSRDER